MEVVWFVLAVCWAFVPFALFGIKPLLRDLLAQQRKTNELLERMSGDTRPR